MGASGNPRAAASLIVGLLGVLAVPAGILLARETGVTLVQAGGAIAVGALLGLAALIEARRGRERAQMTLGRAGGERAARSGRVLAILSLMIAATAGLALGFYGLLTVFAS